MCTQARAIKIMQAVHDAYCLSLGGLRDVYLYGSYARGDYDEESDVDILLTVDLSESEISQARRKIAKIASALSLENDVTVSITLKPAQQFTKYAGFVPFYQNVIREGIRYDV